MSNGSLEKLGIEIAEQTGIIPAEQTGAPEAQAAVKQTITSAIKFIARQDHQTVAERPKPKKEPDREPHGVVLISPYSEDQLRNAEELLREAGIKFREDICQEHKPHLVSALIFASQNGIDSNEVLRALDDHIDQERKRLSYSANSAIPYELGSYFVQEYTVERIARKKDLKTPENLKPSKERERFMAVLADRLDETEKQYLAQYIASTQTNYSISPFSYLSLSFDVTHRKGLERQNIAVTISPQPIERESITTFLSQEGIQKENFLLAMANPHLRKSMPLGALLATNYRVTLQYSPSDRKEVSIREVLEEQIGRSYTERSVGSEPKGLLPFEELAGLVVIDNLKELTQESLESRFTQIIPQVLAADQPLAELEKAFPDIKLFYSRSEMDQLAKDINVIKEAIVHPNQVPPRNFWYRAFTRPNKAHGFFTQVRDELVHWMYQTGGESHLQKWREMADCFIVSKGQDRKGEPLMLTILNDHEIGVFGKDGPRYSLVRREDGQWYPTSYWDRESEKSNFSIEGMSYDELEQQIAASPFQYQIGEVFLREILRESFNDLATRVYKQIKSQVDMEALQQAGVYPSRAATAYRDEGLSRDIQYLGSMTPDRVRIYDSILSALVRHLWQHGKLSETDLSVAVPLTSESVTVRHPLLELLNLSFEEIRRRLKETGTDVRVPEITIRREGYELRAKAWVYETLLKLKELGFDAVLGKTMAEEFNRQAARIYVESALVDLGFLPEDYQREKPLVSLQSRQQALYGKALEFGFTTPLENGYCLSPSLSLPLTWEREKELVQFLEKKLDPDKLKEFYREIGITDDYFVTRDVIETYLNFASGWQWEQFDRSDEFPSYRHQFPGYPKGLGTRTFSRGSGEYVVSSQAQERFEVAKKTWEEFLDEVNHRISRLDTSSKQKVSSVAGLGKDLVAEIDRMSQAEVTEWAEKIIKGEMAAVGRDMQNPIEVKTWADFHEAIKQLMDTARLVLIYLSEKGRFGWEVSTDKEELS